MVTFLIKLILLIKQKSKFKKRPILAQDHQIVKMKPQNNQTMMGFHQLKKIA